jgi:hypothetical protein
MPHATVTLDDHVHGSESEKLRQIDVSARWNDSDESYLLVLQVKHTKRPADVNVLGRSWPSSKTPEPIGVR